MKRVTLAGLNRIAEDHNKHNSGDNWSWEDVLYEECLNGNNIKRDFDRMSKKELLIVIDWAVTYMPSFDGVDRIYQSIYKCAMTSLENKL